MLKVDNNSGNLAKIIGEFIYDDIVKREGEDDDHIKIT